MWLKLHDSVTVSICQVTMSQEWLLGRQVRWGVRGFSRRGSSVSSPGNLPEHSLGVQVLGCLSPLQNERAYWKKSTEMKPGNSMNSTGQNMVQKDH